MTKHIIRFTELINPTKRLFCFPYAGGGAAAYRPWGPLLAPDIEVQAVEYPGRIQLKDKPANNMEELVDVLYPEVVQLLDRPYAFFGHSYGSIVAFALAKRLQHENKPMPIHLFVSSRRAPHFSRETPELGQLSDSEFVKAIQIQYGPIPPAVLNDRDLLALFLPSLKGDIRLNETYLGDINQPLNIPVTVYYGTEDTSGSTSNVDKWKDVTTGRFTMKTFAGGHFFIDTMRAALVKDIASKL